jgi:hypothetical protein
VPWQTCRSICAVCANAVDFKFPPDNLVLYLFNPFGEATLRTVIANLETSLRETPRRVYVIYVKPVQRRVFDESDCFSLLHSVQHDLVYANDAAEFPLT